MTPQCRVKDASFDKPCAIATTRMLSQRIKSSGLLSLANIERIFGLSFARESKSPTRVWVFNQHWTTKRSLPGGEGLHSVDRRVERSRGDWYAGNTTAEKIHRRHGPSRVYHGMEAFPVQR